MLRFHGYTYEDYIQTFNHSIQINNHSIQINNHSNQNNNHINQNNNHTDSNNNTVPYSCTKCNKTFCANWYLTKHMEKCKGIRDKHSCEYCHLEFKHQRSRFGHYKICKVKKERDATALIPFEPPINEPINVNTINNNIQTQNNIDTQNNTTNNIDTQNNTQNIIVVYHQDNIEYSDVHIGNNEWEAAVDKSIYPKLACGVANHMSDYLHAKRDKLRKEAFDKIISFVDYMADEGYINTEDKEKEKRILREYQMFVKELKMIIYNKTKEVKQRVTT